MTRWTTADLPDQIGRLAVVTGSNSGLGLHIAQQLSAAGARVVLACRNEQKAHDAARAIRSRHPQAQLEVRRLDLADLGSVAAFAAGMVADGRPLDLLVNNAGLMAVDESRTADGFETQLGVNHLGHFALTARLLTLMADRAGSRIGTMSSMGHRPGRLVVDDLMFERRGYDRWRAYFQSKLANLLFTAELQRRLEAAGAATIAVAAHPGTSRTDLGQEGSALANRLAPYVMPVITQPAATGALPMLRALTDPAVRGGEYYGPRFVFFGDPTREKPSARARDAGDAAALWERSVELTGVNLPAGLSTNP